MNKMLSVCIITKNEQSNLEHCLKNLSGYGLELVVVDTGSTDRTIEMARSYTDAIYEFAWCDDFAKAKNFAVSKAKHDSVLVLDSDEYLQRIDLDKLWEYNNRFPGAVGRIKRINQIYQGQEIRESQEYISRFFDRRYYHFERKIHEQIVSIDGSSYETYTAPITVEHTGYLLSEQERKQKALRNIRLLEEELKQKKDDAYIIYQLGKSYAMMAEYARASEYFAKALSYDLDPKLEYVIDMVDAYGYALLNSGQVKQALAFEGIYEEFGRRADFQFLMGLIYMNNEKYTEAIAEFMKAAGQKESRVMGVNSYLAYYNAGVISECSGDTKKALALYEKCGNYDPAKKRVAELLSLSAEKGQTVKK